MANKKELTEKEKEEKAYGLKLRLANDKQNYLRNLINGRYYLARVNMIAEQINSGKIEEKIDGCTKSLELMQQEYGLMKYQAITSMRTAHFQKLDLIKEFNLTEKDFAEIEDDYYNGKVIREDYGENVKQGKKAGFVSA